MKASSTKETPTGAVPYGNGTSNGGGSHNGHSHVKPSGSSNAGANSNNNSSSSSIPSDTGAAITSNNNSNSSNSNSNSSGSGGNSSSGSGSGKGTGPRRFRGDVPAFNPSLPHLYSQQMHQYQSQMLRLQPQYYAHQPCIYNGQVMPFYPMAMGYPDYQVYPPFQQYFMNPQFHNSGYVNMAAAANFYTPSAPAMSSRKRYPKDHDYYTDTHPYASPPPSDTLPGDHKREDALRRKMRSPSIVVETSTPDTPKSIDTKETDLPTSKAQSQQEDSEKEQKDLVKAPQPELQPVGTKNSSSIESETTSPVDTLEEEKHSLPLLFQLSMDEYLAEREVSGAINRKLLSTKSQCFDTFVKDKQYSIHGAGMQFVVNHNTGAQKYECIHPQSVSTTKNEPQEALKTKPMAWSAVLQATGAKPKRRDGETVANGAMAASLLGKTAVPRNSDVLEAADVPQTLGLLMMQYLYDPTFKLPLFDVSAQKPRGLTNSGNICYMNVILQCLIFCEPFATLFHLVESKSVANIGINSPTPLIDATLNFLKDYSTIPPSKKSSGGSFNSDGIVVGKPLSPEPFYQKLIENPKFQHLSWGQQEDAEEFLGYVLDGLHEEFVKVEAALTAEQMEALAETFSSRADAGQSVPLKSAIVKAARLVKTSGTEHIEESEVDNDAESNDWSEVGSGRRVCKKRVVEVEPSPITRLFGGRFRSVLTIPKGKELQSITLDPFRCVLLDISLADVHKIEDALWKFNEVEKLQYKVEAGKEVIARKQTFIDKLPEILILHLKRFSYQNEAVDLSASNNGLALELRSYGTIEKVLKNILYGLTLTVPAECLSAALRKENANEYVLTAVIYHHGRNAEGGHYTCDVLRPGRKWLRIDDTAVEAIDADSVLDMSERDKSAYILMYQRRT